jgi:hypothetical protein
MALALAPCAFPQRGAERVDKERPLLPLAQKLKHVYPEIFVTWIDVSYALAHTLAFPLWVRPDDRSFPSPQRQHFFYHTPSWGARPVLAMASHHMRDILHRRAMIEL